MATLANLVVRINGNTAGLTKAVGAAETRVGTFNTKASGAFRSIGNSARTAAGQVPILGGALNALLTPAGLAAGAAGAISIGLGKAVAKSLELGRSLGELREKTGVSAEALQIYQRAVEEGNGKVDALATTLVRLTTSIGNANQGNAAAQQSFDALGLSWTNLAQLSPERALAEVVGRANEVLEPTDRAAVLAGILGRSYSELGGFATLTGAEIATLTEKLSANAVVMSEEAVANVDAYDEAWRNLRDSMGGASTDVGGKVVPQLTTLMNFTSGTVIPVVGTVAEGFNKADQAIFGWAYQATQAQQPTANMYGALDDVTVAADKARGSLDEAANSMGRIDTHATDVAGVYNSLADTGIRVAESSDKIKKSIEDQRQAVLDAANAQDDMFGGMKEGAMTLAELETKLANAEKAVADKTAAVEAAETALTAYDLDVEEAAKSTLSLEEKTKLAETAQKNLETATTALETAMESKKATAEEVETATENWKTAVDAATSAQGLLEQATKDAKAAADNKKTAVEQAEAALANYKLELDRAAQATASLEEKTKLAKTAEDNLKTATAALDLAMADKKATAEEVTEALKAWEKALGDLKFAQDNLKQSTDAATEAAKRQQAVTGGGGGTGGGSTGVGGGRTGGSSGDGGTFGKEDQRIFTSRLALDRAGEQFVRLGTNYWTNQGMPPLPPERIPPGLDAYGNLVKVPETLAPLKAHRVTESAIQAAYGTVPPGLEWLAKGGIVRRMTNAIIGEAGPEAVIPLDRMGEVLGSDAAGGGDVVHINFYGDVYGVDDFDRRVDEARLRFARRGN